jgi:hypothetical protein
MGKIPDRVKRCREIDNVSKFTRDYFVNILTVKKWPGIEH